MPRLPAPTIRALRAAGILPLLALAPAVVAPAALAQGTPRSVSECERLKNDLAYNQCLAMFGPAAKNIAGGDGVGGPVSAPPPGATAMAGIPILEEPAVEESGRRGRRGRHSRSGGRQSASFEVGGSDEAAPTRRRWHRRRR